MPSAPIEKRLARLHAHYTARINAAVAAGRMDLVEDLASECHDEALDMVRADEGTSGLPTEHDVEILDLGAGWPTWRRNLGPHPLRFRFWRRRG